MSTMVACRTCGATHTASIGPLPDVDVFAGKHLGQPLPGGWLHACHDCGFVFRAPVLGDAQYLDLYAEAGADVWEQGAQREDFRLVRSEVPAAALDVLDIGCYTGALLATLPRPCRLHGVEPNHAAAAAARQRGVHVVASHWHGLEGGRDYDIITACDVIEHVGNPLEFLQTMSRHLKPGGKLMITTGNPQAWPWRLTGSRFWYCYFPEHISFIGPRWLARMAPVAGLRLQRLQRFSHSPLPNVAGRATALAKTGLHLLAAAAGRRRPARLPALMLGGGIAPDHIFCVLQRP